MREYDRKVLEEPEQVDVEPVLTNAVLKFNEGTGQVNFLPVHRMQCSKRGKGLR